MADETLVTGMILTEQQAARLNALQQALREIRVEPDETGRHRVRVSHADDGTYVITAVSFPAGQFVTLAEIIAEFEGSNQLPRKADRHG